MFCTINLATLLDNYQSWQPESYCVMIQCNSNQTRKIICKHHSKWPVTLPNLYAMRLTDFYNEQKSTILHTMYSSTHEVHTFTRLEHIYSTILETTGFCLLLIYNWHNSCLKLNQVKRLFCVDYILHAMSRLIQNNITTWYVIDAGVLILFQLSLFDYILLNYEVGLHHNTTLEDMHFWAGCNNSKLTLTIPYSNSLYSKHLQHVMAN